MSDDKAHRLSYTAGFKLKVIEYAKKNGNRAAARLFKGSPSESTIRDWIKKEEKLKTLPETKCNFRQSPPKWPHLEEKLSEWVLKQEKDEKGLTAKMILEEGKKMSSDLKIEDFHGTRTWCQRFIKRHDIQVVKTSVIPSPIRKIITKKSKRKNTPRKVKPKGQLLIRINTKLMKTM